MCAELCFSGYTAHARRNHRRAVPERLPQSGVPEPLMRCLAQTDVLYVTRVQKERFETRQLMRASKAPMSSSTETMKHAKEHMIVMHPLPRVGEISMDVDDDPRAAYFRQMEYGLYVRMALLAMVLGKA